MSEFHHKRPQLVWINHYAGTPADATGTRHFELGQFLSARGWGVTLLASDFQHHSRRYTRRQSSHQRDPIVEQYGDLDIAWLWAAAYQLNDWRRVWNWITFGRSVSRYRGRRHPSLVIGSSPHLFAALAGARIARRWGVPFVFEVRDLWPESIIAGGGRRGPGYYGLTLIARYLYRRADRIIVLAEGSRDYLIDRFDVPPDRIVFIPNGVDLTMFKSPTVRREGDRLKVLYAGAHGPANGLMTVVEAADRLRSRPEIQFLLVGDGPVKPALQEEARRRGLQNIEFRDPVPKQAMPSLLAEADVGLMVLRQSDLFSFGVSPNKLFDYFAAGLPVVCNVPGEIGGVVKHAGAGVLTEDSSAAALAAAIERMTGITRQERAQMGEAGRQWVVRERDRALLAGRLDAALRSLI